MDCRPFDFYVRNCSLISVLQRGNAVRSEPERYRVARCRSQYAIAKVVHLQILVAHS